MAQWTVWFKSDVADFTDNHWSRERQSSQQTGVALPCFQCHTSLRLYHPSLLPSQWSFVSFWDFGLWSVQPCWCSCKVLCTMMRLKKECRDFTDMTSLVLLNWWFKTTFMGQPRIFLIFFTDLNMDQKANTYTYSYRRTCSSSAVWSAFNFHKIKITIHFTVTITKACKVLCFILLKILRETYLDNAIQ